ncbi:unnamed protein product [Porites evermanni]|uniref:Uncharacterized protein n=1 Tax=Porites evermanni TaxID=104178 RepID=A0ABN8SWF6_9CNID|nr:unnamed protein product [Porites evermanni]
MVLALSFTFVCPAIGEDHERNYTSKSLKIAWTEKPPYAFTSQTTEEKFIGFIREAIWQYLVDCGEARGISYQINTSKFESEFKMVESLKNNQVHIAAPIFELTNNRTYSKFPFLELDHYPGTEYITNEEQINALSVVLDAVKRSWPLFAVTLVLTAIAGIVMWALDTYWNSEEFPRSFIRGSWDGFWWSFISMTTVGWQKRKKKCAHPSIFFWVAVLGNGTEFQHARYLDAHPEVLSIFVLVYYKIEDIIEALQVKKVEGMLLDSYTASFYQSREKLESLVTVKKFELRRDVGILISKEKKDLANCLENHRPSILRHVQTLTQQMPMKRFDLFDESSVKGYLFSSLGVLAGLIVFGAVWDIFSRMTTRLRQKVASVNIGSFRAGREPRGLLRKTVWEFIELGCVDSIDYHIESFQVFSISDLIGLVQEGKAHVGLPVVLDNFGENSANTKGTHIVKVLDHPGIEFIASSKTNKQALSVILIAVLQAWPLLIITMLLTAIAGVIVWALDSRWNSDEFSRSFLKGSWEGFWWSFVSMTTVGMIITDTDDDFLKFCYILAYETVDKMEAAVKAKEVEGILIDHYTAFYYFTVNGTFKTLFSRKKIEVSQGVTVIVAREHEELVDCLSLNRPAMISAVQAITNTYKLNLKTAPRGDTTLQIDSPQVYLAIYLLSGVLGILVTFGLVWEILYNKKKVKQTESDPEATKACKFTRDTSTIGPNSATEGDQLIAWLKDYIDRIQKASREKVQERV